LPPASKKPVTLKLELANQHISVQPERLAIPKAHSVDSISTESNLLIVDNPEAEHLTEEPSVNRTNSLEIENRLSWEQDISPTKTDYPEAPIISSLELDNDVEPEYMDAWDVELDELETNEILVSDESEIDLSQSDDHIILEEVFAEDGVNVLLEGLEEGMQLVVAEYVGELAIGLLGSLVEIDAPLDVIKEPAEEFSNVEEVTSGVNDGETTPSLDLAQKFDVYLESLEPTNREAVEQVIELLVSVLSNEQPPFKNTIEGISSNQGLESICLELLGLLNMPVKSGGTIIKQFIEALQKLEEEAGDYNPVFGINYLNNMGTNEYKQFRGATLLDGLTGYLKIKLQPNLAIGRYTLLISGS
jgi:hypothetical protein